jgi:hypothetical protein
MADVKIKYHRRGMTLVELLVATTVTLLLVFAITQGFAVISQTVTMNRATVEMAGQMRNLSLRLQRDLETTTVPMRPWPLSSSGLGYFEIVEGRRSDIDADNDGTADAVELFNNPGSGIDTSIGDFDDVVMFTAYSSGEPFTGQVLGTLVSDGAGGYTLEYDPANPVITPIQSDVAEIVWWLRVDGYTDVNVNGSWDSGEPIRISMYRRTLLVRPDIDISDADLQPAPGGNVEMPHSFFFSANDLSVRYEPQGNQWYRRTNSLEHLTRRENRVAHRGLSDSGTSYFSFPFRMQRDLLTPKRSVWQRGNDGVWGNPGDDDVDGMSDELDEAGWIGSDDLLVHAAVGSDVVATNVLSFDIQVFDTSSPTLKVVGLPEAIRPTDPGYLAAVTHRVSNPNDVSTIGRGNYVDLGFAFTLYGKGADNRFLSFPVSGVWTVNPFIASSFSGLPNAKSRLRPNTTGTVANHDNTTPMTYDTWSFHYEQDGLDQNLNGEAQSPLSYGLKRADGQDNNNNGEIDEWIDEGTNGLDDDNANGADDVEERETSPPYPEPLRGVRVQVRMIDPDTRQVRQMTVSADFTPE